MPGTGRARSCVSFLLGPESMRQYRFQILTWLLILWQLLLPTGAPWLHTVVDGSCCADSCGAHSSTTCQHSHSGCSYSHKHAGKRHGHSHVGHDCETEENESCPEPKPHDCANCEICQAIADPRLIALLTELPAASEEADLASVPECADRLLGFGLPPQCRAPPKV